jgi:hypothetical protein
MSQKGIMNKMEQKCPGELPPLVENPTPVAVLVVHGIGDQVRNATVQQVVAQFSEQYSYRKQPVPVEVTDPGPPPLGAFDPGPVSRNFVTVDREDYRQYRRFDFSEVYWADIPRQVVDKGYTLEEAKAWASVIVERMERHERKRSGGSPSKVNFPLVQQVVGEMIQTIGVLERLTFIADKAGVAKFDLNRVLVDYLDDVQLVAEFKDKRDAIVATFTEALEKIDKKAEIYIVAHSEGTVVSFLGLLEAMWKPVPPEWLSRVRGYLTIGSPIDKHLVLWPELFEKWETTQPAFNPKPPENGAPDLRIKWRNYYDHGDPVGFELDYARRWLQKGAEWCDERKVAVTAFQFDGRYSDPKTKKIVDPGHDIGFSRYYLPGKAHNDYWTDPAVFKHFIDSVIKPSEKQLTAKSEPESSAENSAVRPPNKWGVWPVAYLVSYALPLILLIFSVFFVIRSVTSFNAEALTTAAVQSNNPQAAQAAAKAPAIEKKKQDRLGMMGDAAGIACLLAGMTVVGRMPRLANPHLSLKWMFIALGIFALSAWGFCRLTNDASIQAMGKLPEFFIRLRDPDWQSIGNETALKRCLIALALMIALGAAWAGRRFVGSGCGRWSCGSKPLIILGGLTAVIMVLRLLNIEGSGGPSLWPVMLALAAFLYVWWLAILLFDLIFVWHRYVRHEVANQRMEGTAN